MVGGMNVERKTEPPHPPTRAKRRKDGDSHRRDGSIRVANIFPYIPI